jgi:hypothetical protein
MNFSTKNILTGKNLSEKVDSYQIFKAYCTNFSKLGISFCSDMPDRPKKDTNASCRIAYINGDLLYTDFGEGSYRPIPYVMRRFGLSYRDALRKINQDFSAGLIDTDRTPVERTIIAKSKTPDFLKRQSHTIIDVKYSDWSWEDLDYWEDFGWTLEMAKRASIRPISNFWLTMPNKGMRQVPFCVEKELAFSYDFYRHNGIFRRKLYFPERKGIARFVSNVDNTVIQNWDLLPKNGGDTLFITSSKKDTGPFWRLNGWVCNSIAPNNEITFIPEKIFYTKIKPRWKRIIGWLDNDETGIENSLIWAQKYGIQAVWNPLRAPKDPSDFVKAHGLREFNWLKNNLIK